MDLSSTFIRELEIGDGNTLQIHQICYGDVGCVVWDAALVLAKYLLKQSTDKSNDGTTKLSFNHASVIELGSGTGIVGLTAAALGSDVIMTDLKECVPLLWKNIHQNKDILQGTAIAMELKWGSEDNNIINQAKPVDYILISDCIYYAESLKPLVTTIDILSNKGTTILLCFEKRLSPEKLIIEKEFFKIVKEKFQVRTVSHDELDHDYQSDDIHVVMLTKI